MRVKVLMVILVILLIVAVGVNYGNIRDIVTGRRTFMDVLLGRPLRLPADEMRMPASPAENIGEIVPIGPEDAKVKVVAYLMFTNPCHWATVETLRELAEKHEDKIRVDFVNVGTEEGAKQLNEAFKKSPISSPHSCMAWVSVNGKFEFELEGVKGKVQLSGPIHPGGPVAELLEKVVRRELALQEASQQQSAKPAQGKSANDQGNED
ncbi:MAG TPA: hypothetical protein EYP10_13965 [Armatimonadetes bacterium]|nr:hypothetical protein [Armatimonadota bacterium]